MKPMIGQYLGLFLGADGKYPQNITVVPTTVCSGAVYSDECIDSANQVLEIVMG
ncbi:hypothetical protein ACSYAD_02940 [Acaryochloris marina NIES-2412]|uniref:hypothetical protein n=1 Tax=Acaryochloris marina TaxID=155978 RepID=UPI00405A1E20